MRADSHTQRAHVTATPASDPASSYHGMEMALIRMGMMTGAENGIQLTISASRLGGVIMTGWAKMMLKTSSITTGCAAWLASSWLEHIAPTAANSAAYRP